MSIKNPRSYQSDAVAAVVDGLKSEGKGQLILPCGAGKTLVSLWIAQKLKAKRILVLVPSLSLLKQIKDQWTEQGVDKPRLCVCSEKDIDSDSLSFKLSEIDANVSNDPTQISKFIHSNKEFVIYGTYQSLDKICQSSPDVSKYFDIVICDEAHKAAGAKHKISRFSIIHSEEMSFSKYKLFMTATPRMIKGKSLKAQSSIFSMDNEDYFGKVFYSMTFGEAIEKKILIDYKIIGVAISCEEINKVISKDNIENTLDNINRFANNYALDKFMNEYGATHVVTFHSSIAKSKQFLDDHQKISQIPIFHVNGKQSAKQRKKTLDDFESNPSSIITNSRCLTEGIDVPAIDAVYFCDPKNSKIDILQAVGRALRRADHKGKKTGYIVVPLFHSPTNEIDRALGEGSFSNMISIIRSIMSEDSSVYEQMKHLKLKSSDKDKELNVDNLSIIASNGEGIIDDKLKQQIYFEVIKKFNKTRYASFQKVKAIVKEKGIKTQRQYKDAKKNGILPTDVPWAPDESYKSVGWVGWGDFLGTGRTGTKNFLPYQEAKILITKLNINSKNDYDSHVTLENKRGNFTGLPSTPHKTYKEWLSWPDFLGRPEDARKKVVRLTFDDCKKFVKKYKLTGKNAYHKMKFAKTLPINIPWKPYDIYKTEWKGWKDYLGATE